MNMENEKDKIREVPVSVENSNVVIALRATTVSQDLELDGQPTADSQQSAVIRHFITHEAIGVSRLLRQAKKYIVLHAAFYPKYADGEQGDDIKKVMVENHDLQLKVIFTDLNAPWVNEFAVLLRDRFADIKLFEKEISDDIDDFVRLQKNPDIGRDRVEICYSARLPMFPVILIDDTLIVGHYAHSREIAPNGLWVTIQHPNISLMYKSLLDGDRPKCNTPEERAILRYVEELVSPDFTPIQFGSS